MGYILAILKKIFCRTAKGNQGIKVIKPDPAFLKELRGVFDEYRRDFETVGFEEGWAHTNDFGSFTHYIYAIVSYYKIRNVYEIGTYKGNTIMMLLSYFLRHNINNFLLHTIDTIELFNVGIFSTFAREGFKNNRDKVLFEKGNSQENKLSKGYDLAIIDGEHAFRAVFSDFLTVKDHVKYVLFDDLHLGMIFEKTYSEIIKNEWVEEVFRVYTNDRNDAHCIGLIALHNERAGK